MNLEEILGLVSGTATELQQGISIILDMPESITTANDSDLELLYTILAESLKNLEIEIPNNTERWRIKRPGVFALMALQKRHSTKTPYNHGIAEALSKIHQN